MGCSNKAGMREDEKRTPWGEGECKCIKVVASVTKREAPRTCGEEQSKVEGGEQPQAPMEKKNNRVLSSQKNSNLLSFECGWEQEGKRERLSMSFSSNVGGSKRGRGRG